MVVSILAIAFVLRLSRNSDRYFANSDYVLTTLLELERLHYEVWKYFAVVMQG